MEYSKPACLKTCSCKQAGVSDKSGSRDATELYQVANLFKPLGLQPCCEHALQLLGISFPEKIFSNFSKKFHSDQLFFALVNFPRYRKIQLLSDSLCTTLCMTRNQHIAEHSSPLHTWCHISGNLT